MFRSLQSGEMGHLKLMNSIKLYPQLRKSEMEVESYETTEAVDGLQYHRMRTL